MDIILPFDWKHSQDSVKLWIWPNITFTSSKWIMIMSGVYFSWWLDWLFLSNGINSKGKVIESGRGGFKQDEKSFWTGKQSSSDCPGRSACSFSCDRWSQWRQKLYQLEKTYGECWGRERYKAMQGWSCLECTYFRGHCRPPLYICSFLTDVFWPGVRNVRQFDKMRAFKSLESDWIFSKVILETVVCGYNKCHSRLVKFPLSFWKLVTCQQLAT